MRKTLVLAGLVMVLALGSVQAGIDINEVGAFLVYPGVVAAYGEGPTVETFLTITNTSIEARIAHLSFFNGNEFDSRYCYECDYDVPLTGQDTETLVVTISGGTTHIRNLDTGGSRSCTQTVGFVTVDVERDLATHEVLQENILLGEEIVVDYASGIAFSVEAIPIQGVTGNTDRTFAFDEAEYRKFPSVVGANFLAPTISGSVSGSLVLFTLGFERQFPPLTDCSIIGFDAWEQQFSNSFQFGCWTVRSLVDIDPEFAYPNLGIGEDGDQHGWLQLACTVFGTGLTEVADGGVHGAILQTASGGAQLRYPDGPVLSGNVAWSRLLFQSGTVGDSLTLHTEDAVGGGF